MLNKINFITTTLSIAKCTEICLIVTRCLVKVKKNISTSAVPYLGNDGK